MSLNMKSLTQALAKTAAVIEKTVQNTVHEVTGPKALQEYELLEQVGSGGLGLIWKIYAARHRNRSTQMLNQDVCVWVLDKKILADARQRAGLSKAVEDAFLDIVRADAMQMVKLRHPGVVQLVQGLDESKGAMAMVTEPISASLANVLGHLDNVAQPSKLTKSLELKQLEIKHGLWQLAESLSFLHNNARLVHCAVSPETVFITSSGAWKLAGFGFALSLDQVTSDTSGGPAFHYPAYDADDACLPLQPHLNYIAPELTRSNISSLRTSIDTFSLACLAYHLLARRSLIDSKNNIKRYTSRVKLLMDEKFENIPPDLVPDLRRMLNPDELARPSALDFTNSPFFRDDTRFRALRFLDHMLERDNMQKSEFLKSLANMWTEFDPRVLRYKVLPPLCAELRNVAMQSLILPMVLTIAESQEKVDFELSTFPALIPVLSSCTGDSLLLLVKHAAMLINKVTPEQLIANVVPMLVRAYDDPDGRMQEEVLLRTLSFAKLLDFQIMKQAILPRLHALALKTTVSAVRVNALLCLGELVVRLDKQAVLEILKTLQRCTAVDHSAPTLMCTLGVANSIYKQFGIELAAEHLLPLLSPLLVAQQLNLQQFAKYMLFVKSILRKIEEKRGVTLNESDPSVNSQLGMTVGLSETTGDGMHAVVNGVGQAASVKTCRNSWDVEDWGPMAKGHSGIATALPIAGSKLASEIQTPMDTIRQSGNALNAPSVVHAIASAPSISSSSYMGTLSSAFEWPPPKSLPISGPMVMSSGPSNQLSLQQRDWAAASSVRSCETTGENNKANAYSGTVLDDFDPFLDWPPNASTGSIGGSKLSTSQGNLGSVAIGMLAYSNSNSLNGSVSNASNVGSVSVYKEEPSSQSGLGELFSSVKPQSELTPLKLAPPPSGGIGRGRRRNSIRPAQSSKTNSVMPPNQLPPFDLI